MSTEKEELERAAEEAGIVIPDYHYAKDIDDIDQVLSRLTLTQDTLAALFENTARAAKGGNAGAVKLLLKLSEQMQLSASASVTAIKSRNGFKKSNVELKLKHRQQITAENKNEEDAVFSSEMLKVIQNLVKGDTKVVTTTLDDDSLAVTGKIDKKSEDEADNLIGKQLKAVDTIQTKKASEKPDEVTEDTSLDGLELMASMSGFVYTFNNDTGELKPYFFEDSSEHIQLDVEIDEETNEYVVYLSEQRIPVYEIDEN